MKERLDVLLVKRNLAESREKAKAIIMSGAMYLLMETGKTKPEQRLMRRRHR